MEDQILTAFHAQCNCLEDASGIWNKVARTYQGIRVEWLLTFYNKTRPPKLTFQAGDCERVEMARSSSKSMLVSYLLERVIALRGSRLMNAMSFEIERLFVN